MKLFADFFMLALTAIFAENAILARGLGMSRMIRMPQDSRKRIRFSLVLTAMTTLCSILCWALFPLIRQTEYVAVLRPILFLGCMCLLYLIAWAVMAKLTPRFFQRIRPIFSMATFNCAVLGTALLSAQSSMSFLGMLGFGIGSGIGYMAAALLVYQVQRRLELCEVPKAFHGLPITLVYIGLLSLAVYGLVGHRLPI